MGVPWYINLMKWIIKAPKSYPSRHPIFPLITSQDDLYTPFICSTANITTPKCQSYQSSSSLCGSYTSHLTPFGSWTNSSSTTSCDHAYDPMLYSQCAPKGYLPVRISNSNSHYYLVKIDHLYHPLLAHLLHETALEFGYSQHGTLQVSCDPVTFETILEILNSSCHR